MEGFIVNNEFNKKYRKWLEEGHYGLDIDLSDETLKKLDEKFQEFIKRPDFTYSQIKLKFGMGRFYAKGLTREEEREIEKLIEEKD